MPLNARITQVDRESVIEGSPLARITQVDRESVVEGSPQARVTQVDRESVVAGRPKARVTQVVREAVVSFVPFVVITTRCPIRGAHVDESFSFNLQAAGGAPPLTWTLTAGALPDGLSLNPDGTISGTPTEAGIFAFTVKATNS